jgi:hypothetical protein
MRKEDFKTARQLIDKLNDNNNDPEMRQRAQGLLTQLVAVEEHLARTRKEKERFTSDSRNSPGVPNSLAVSADAVEKYDPSAALRESLRRPAAGEMQTQGTLVRIDCDAKGIAFTVRINNRLLKLKTDSFSHVDLTSYSEDAGREVTCGPRKPEDNVVVCYLPLPDARARIDGTAKSFEFVPKDFKLKP